MKSPHLIIFFSLLWSFAAQGLELEWVERTCQERQSETSGTKPCGTNKSIQNLTDGPISRLASDLPEDYSELAVFTGQLEPLLQSLERRQEDWKDIKRWLLDPSESENPQKNEALFEQYSSGAELLLEAYTALEMKKRQLETCRQMGCGPSRTLELEDEKKQLENWLLTLSAQKPWWISEEFDEYAQEFAEDHLEKGGETIQVGDEQKAELKELLNSNLADFHSEIFQLKGELRSMQKLEEWRDSQGKDTSKESRLFYEFSMRYSGAFDLSLKYILSNSLSELDPFRQKSLCQLAKKRAREKELADKGSNALEWGLVGASILSGPDLYSVHALGKISRLLPSLSTRSRAMAMAIPEGALSVKFANEWRGLDRKCQLLRHRLTPQERDEEQALIDYRQCLDERSKAMVGTLLSATGTGGIAGLPLAQKAFKAFRQSRASETSIHQFDDIGELLPYLESEGFKSRLRDGQRVELSIPDKGHYSLMDLGARTETDELARDYWSHVGEVYRRRLNLSDEEIENFLASSRQMEDRTKLIVHSSRGPPNRQDIEGGVAYVETNNAEDLLPLEKATNFRVDRESGKSIEIVRLTSGDRDIEGMNNLLKQSARMVENDTEIQNIYIFTSKTHERLYRRLKIPYEVVEKPNDRDVILKMNSQDFVENLR